IVGRVRRDACKRGPVRVGGEHGTDVGSRLGGFEFRGALERLARRGNQTDPKREFAKPLQPPPTMIDRVVRGPRRRVDALVGRVEWPPLVARGSRCEKVPFSLVWMLLRIGLPRLRPTPPPSLRANSASMRSRWFFNSHWIPMAFASRISSSVSNARMMSRSGR